MAYFHKDTQPFCLGALAGALLISYAGFNHFGWMLGSTAISLGKRQSELAVVGAYAQICKAQFGAATNQRVQMVALEKMDRYQRGEFIDKGGWATMTGAKEPVSGVGQACADLLIPEKA